MMPSLIWSDALSLSMPVMDATHMEFVELLGQAEAADDATLVKAWRTLVEHTVEHFAREDQWMRDTGFAHDNCHSAQHAVVLGVLQEGLARGEQGDLPTIRQMAQELGQWFPHHAQNMDFGLTLHLKSMGYDPETTTTDSPRAHPLTPGVLVHPRSPPRRLTTFDTVCPVQ